MSHSGSPSRSGSSSRSHSSSRSSSNSMKLPEPAAPPQPHQEVAGEAPAQAYPFERPQEAEQPRDIPSIFIGLGPQGRNITSEDLTELLKSKATNPENIHDVRMRGRCAFADTTTAEEARHLINQLHDTLYKETVRLTVDMSRQTHDEARERKRDSRHAADTLANGGSQVFVSLGPKGDDVSNEEVRARIEAVCPVLKMERRGFCIFADVSSPEDTQKVTAALHDTEINGARLIVKAAEVRRKRERDGGEGRHRGGRSPRRGEDRRDEHGRGRRGGGGRRSRSREVGRHRDRHHRGHRGHHGRRSYSASSRSSSSGYSRGRRSWSSGSVDSRGPRRGGRRGGGRRGGHGAAVPRHEERRDERHFDDRRRDERRELPRREERRDERRDLPRRTEERRDDRRDDRRGDRRDRR